ncbi:hypothetical protein EVG20_g8467 [Dentipellis fragilis]|uniref:Uncharacterized protein n=1 Tax=Dentipellis fragilis TaxID=205917 RepID=A0A4Y9Y559_9AGAM|nr:hypothetical protein EVG20_g8467 [Dentipellis fragilis]
MADNQFSEIWAATIKQYEADSNINITDASCNLTNITSVDELLGMIDGEQKKFRNYQKRLQTLRAFPPAKIVFVAVKLLLNAAENVSAHYKAIVNIFARMQTFLDRCKTYVKGNISLGLQQRLVEILAHLLSVIGTVMKDMKGGWLKHFFHSVLTKDNVMEDALQKLNDLTREEALASLADIHDKVGQALQGVDDLTKAQRDAELDECFDWLSAPDPWVNHEAAQEKLSREQRTGHWIFDDQKFVDWKKDIHSSMWLYGKPRSGKSVLCSTIIKMLQDHKSKTSCAVAFFYFDFRNPSKQTCYNLLKSLIVQLGSQGSDAHDTLKRLYADHDNGRRLPSKQKLHDALGDILKQLGSPYIILDALDECLQEDRHDFLFSFLDEMVLGKEYPVHFLATSRNEVDIKDSLNLKVSHAMDLDMLVHHDIEEYLSAVLQTDNSFQKYDAGLKKEIRDTLLDKADGMTAQVGNSQILRLLLEEGPDINAQIHEYGTALIAASYRGHIEIAQILLQEGAEINAQAGEYGTALIAASYWGHTEIAQILLQKGADVNAQAGKYGTALVAALYWSHTKIFNILLERGAEINTQAGEYGTALIAASYGGYIEIAQMLLQKDADVNAQAGEYGTALIAASYQGHTEIAQILLQKGADLDAQAGEHGTALEAACGKKSMIELLYRYGAK